MTFLPINRQDMNDRGWEELDFLYISGDSYVDHPSFGHSIVTRMFESQGYRVGIISLPDINNVESIKIMGDPKIAVLISSGVIDSMVNHYTVSKKKRSKDEYAPGGKAGLRPDRAVIVYSKLARQAFGDTPILIGGIEASLRRFAHYDYWADKVMDSILVDSTADLLMYGMGEKTIWDICKLLDKGVSIKSIKDIKGTAYLSSYENLPKKVKEAVEINKIGENVNGVTVIYSSEEVKESMPKYAKAVKVEYDEHNHVVGSIIVQKHGDNYVVQNMAQVPLTEKEMDKVYSLPYERTYHPSYEKDGGIPAIKEVELSITSHRGCFGSCTFCAITFHQGRVIQKRSFKSITTEAEKLTHIDNFKGYIHDVGGPTANFRNPSCAKQLEKGVCKNRECLFPEPCPNLDTDHSEYLKLLKEVRGIENIKKVFIRSGIRYDYLINDKNDEFFKELVKYHISGQLKVAPEHVSERVLYRMGKPKAEVYKRFVRKYERLNEELCMNQFLVPYMISSHPGSTLKDSIELAEYLRDINHMPEQVQDFYPTPGTLATAMYYTGLDPRDMSTVYVPKTVEEKAMQRAMLQYRKKENYRLVYEVLKRSGRLDLVGFDKKCLIKPTKEIIESTRNVSKTNNGKTVNTVNKSSNKKTVFKDNKNSSNKPSKSYKANPKVLDSRTNKNSKGKITKKR